MLTRISIFSERDGIARSIEASAAAPPEIVIGDRSVLGNIAEKQSVFADACIYCGSKIALTDEHVIPYAWGGNLQIHRGSCTPCQKLTSTFENFALNDGVMTEVRKIREIQSRSDHRSARSKIRVVLVKNGMDVEAEISVEKLPLILGFPWLDQPALLSGAQDSSLGFDGWILLAFGPDLDAFLHEQGASELRFFEERKRTFSFAQTMAKIAFAYACRDRIWEIIGRNDDLVDAFMHGQDQRLGAFVGMKQPPFERFEGVDFLQYRLHVPGLFLCMDVQPFADVPAPTYSVVLGRCKNLVEWKQVQRAIRSGLRA